jgi:hypothetical protein
MQTQTKRSITETEAQDECLGVRWVHCLTNIPEISHKNVAKFTKAASTTTSIDIPTKIQESVNVIQHSS